MTDLPHIRQRKEVARSQLFRIEALDLTFSNGEQRRYERLASRGAGAVIIVAVTEDDEILLVREYAAGLERYELGLPKGRLDAGESAQDGAVRELMEEAGFGAKRSNLLGDLSLAPAYMSHRTTAVLLRDLYPERRPGDEPEPLVVVRWPLADIGQLLLRDDVTEGRSIAALFMAQQFLQRESEKRP